MINFLQGKRKEKVKRSWEIEEEELEN